MMKIPDQIGDQQEIAERERGVGGRSEGTVYLVLDCAADMQTVVSDLLSSRYRHPLRVVAFNTPDGGTRVVTAEIAREVLGCAVELDRECQPLCAISWSGRMRKCRHVDKDRASEVGVHTSVPAMIPVPCA
jgi:hypothetical protein